LKKATFDGREKAKYICFTAGGMECAVPAEEAMEITRMRGITRLPGAPPYIRGIVSLEGEILPVVDLAMRLGLERRSSGPEGTYLVAGRPGARAVLIVDSVEGIRTFDAARLGPAKGGAFVSGTIMEGGRKGGRRGGRAIRLIDIDGVLDIGRHA